MSKNRIRLAVAAMAALAMLVVAGTAQASSIVFIRGGDIWLTTPDGTREHQVTSGGTFTEVTQSDDGRIFASDGGIYYSFAPDGTVLAGPVGSGYTLDLDANPSGTKLAYWYPTSDGGTYRVLNPDGHDAPDWDYNDGWYPTWIRDDLMLVPFAGYLYTVEPGTGNWQKWTGDPDGYRFHSTAITRANDRLVAVIRDFDDVGPWKVAHYSNSSQPPLDDEGHAFDPPPPSERPQVRCTEDFGGVEPSHPSFSPDGGAIAWEFPDGIHVQPVFDLNSCAQPPGGFVIAGAKSPDFGPADVPAEPAPVTTGGGAKKCVVPKLKGKKLRKAKKLIKKAHCKVGKVKKKKSRKKAGTVIKQSPKPGARRKKGAKVRLVVARRR